MREQQSCRGGVMEGSMKPILFQTEMVRAILEGRKSVTRRNPFQMPPDYDVLKGMYRDSKDRLCAVFQCRKDPTTEAAYARYDRGDILWVRETWGMASDLLGAVPGPVYRADYTENELRALVAKHYRWRPSIHMPRKAARIFLRVTEVRVERLQSLNTSDLIAEGITPRHSPGRCRCAWAVDGCMDGPCPNRDGYEFFAHLKPFAELWDRTMRPADRPCYGWEANPWVWVITFERISKEEAGSNGETEY